MGSMDVGCMMSGFQLQYCPRGGNWRNLDFSVIVKDVSNFHKCHHGGGFRVSLNVCVYMSVYRISYRILSFGRGGTPKFGVDVAEIYSTKQLGGDAPPEFN